MINILQWLDEQKFSVVIRSSQANDAEDMIKCVLEGGLRTLEISMYTPQALRLIETYSKKDGILVGAGSINDGETVQRAVNAGAQFISSQATDLEVVNVAKHNDTFVIQGAQTLTEALEANKMGVDLIKIYPVDTVGGLNHVKAIKHAAPFLKLVADGGITFEDAFEYIKHCVAVNLRDTVFERQLLRADSWSEVTERVRQFAVKLESLKPVKQPT